MEHCWSSLKDIPYLLEHVISIAFHPTSVTHRQPSTTAFIAPMRAWRIYYEYSERLAFGYSVAQIDSSYNAIIIQLTHITHYQRCSKMLPRNLM